MTGPEPSLIGLLDPHREVAGFVGRDAELGELLAWCADGSDAPVRLVIGPAGAGKTRLAVELAHRMRARGWRTEWLPAESPGSAARGFTAARAFTAPTFTALAIAQRKSLLIIDDADRRSGLGDLLTGLVEDQPQARVLLLARDAGGWCDQAELGGTIAHAVVAAARSALIDISEDCAVSELSDGEVAGLAAIAFAGELQRPSRTVDLAGPRSVGRYPILDLHVAALVTVAREAAGPVSPPAAVDELLDLETTGWSTAEAGPDLLRRLAATGLLLGASTPDEVAAVINRVAGPNTQLDDWLTVVLDQARGWPELLVRRFAGAELGAAEFAGRCLANLDAGQLTRVVWLLAQAGEDGRDWVPGGALELVAGQVEGPDGPPEVLTGLFNALPYPSVTWARAGAALCGRIVAGLDGDADLGVRAYWLNNFSARLWLAGRQDEAVAAAEEAATIRRELAATAPGRYLASLALTLTYLGIQYAGLGRIDDAFKVTEEAAEVRRQLAASDPDRYALPPGDDEVELHLADGLFEAVQICVR